MQSHCQCMPMHYILRKFKALLRFNLIFTKSYLRIFPHHLDFFFLNDFFLKTAWKSHPWSITIWLKQWRKSYYVVIKCHRFKIPGYHIPLNMSNPINPDIASSTHFLCFTFYLFQSFYQSIWCRQLGLRIQLQVFILKYQAIHLRIRYLINFFKNVSGLTYKLSCFFFINILIKSWCPTTSYQKKSFAWLLLVHWQLIH